MHVVKDIFCCYELLLLFSIITEYLITSNFLHHAWVRAPVGSRTQLKILKDRSGDDMVSMFTSSAVDRGFQPRSGQTKAIKSVSAASQGVLGGNSRDWMARNQDSVSECNMSIRRLCYIELAL